MNLELQKALERDGDKLRGITGQDCGPIQDDDLEAWVRSLGEGLPPEPPTFRCLRCGRTYNKERVLNKHQARYNHHI